MSEEPGGFIPLSPPPSSIASSSLRSTLPHPRRTPLKTGGAKESTFIRFVDQRILHVQRRFAKRDSSLGLRNAHIKEVDEEGRLVQEIGETTARSDDWNDVPGYAGFGEAAAEVEEIVNVIWISGTPSLQVPYLISLALLVNTMISGFPAAPRPLFRLLGKLDHAFASLIRQRDVDTGEDLPGFIMQRGVSGTEKVRIKSLVERTRICVVDVMSSGDFEEDDVMPEQSIQSDIEGDLVLENENDLDLELDDDDVYDDWDMQVARVYDRTLMEMGQTMDGPEIGVRTEPIR